MASVDPTQPKSLAVGRNAAIWYARDGYEPAKAGLNGRRVAGSSFLDGFLQHADVGEFVSLTSNADDIVAFQERIARAARPVPYRTVPAGLLQQIAPLGTIFYSSPRYNVLCWRRRSLNDTAFSICGLTHTTDTKGVMSGWLDLRMAPQQEWDAVICTSRAVQAASRRNVELADDYLAERFGYVLPPRPKMPVIPLGIDAASFAFGPQDRAALREPMGWTEDDVVVVTVARLLPHGKFDPAPLFIALQKAQERLGTAKRLRYVAYGVYGNDKIRQIFQNCAGTLMPDVSFHHMDGKAQHLFAQVLAGGDIFAFPIDNTQEAFGLAPVEAMAAGLPVVASDWDGLRDTITPDVGMLAPTSTVRAEATRPEAHGYLDDRLTYGQYGGRLSTLVSIDVPKLADSFVALAENPDLRKRMGATAKQRAAQVYDWSVVIPQMQDLWAELNAIRTAAIARGKGSPNGWRANPVAPLPTDLFAAYPTTIRSSAQGIYVAVETPDRLRQIWAVRAYEHLGHPAETLDTLERVFAVIVQAGASGTNIARVAQTLRFNIDTVARCWQIFAKFGLIAAV